jgi:hypothetical protein
MTYGFDEPRERKDLWYWMSLVVTLSHSSGLHHCPERNDNSAAQNRVNRRLWWCVFTRNQLVAFGLRRRARVHYKDRISLLAVPDFECDPLPIELASIWKDCLILREPLLRTELAMLCIEKCKLVVCLSEIMSSQFRSTSMALPLGEGTKTLLVPKETHNANSQSGVFLQRLENWALRLPAVCRYEPVALTSISRSPVLIIHQATLRMLYLTTAGVLHSPQIIPCAPSAASASLALDLAINVNEATQSTLRHLADEILHTGLDLEKKSLVSLLPSISLTAILAATLIHSIDFQTRSTTDLSRSIQQYVDSASILRHLCDNYPVGESALAFLDAASAGNLSWPSHPEPSIATVDILRATTGPDQNAFPNPDDQSDWLDGLSLQSATSAFVANGAEAGGIENNSLPLPPVVTQQFESYSNGLTLIQPDCMSVPNDSGQELFDESNFPLANLDPAEDWLLKNW